MTTNDPTPLDLARRLGADHGHTSATWVEIDDPDTAAELLDDPTGPMQAPFIDLFNSDGQREALDELAEVVEVDDPADIAEDIRDEYREGFREGYGAEVERAASEYLRTFPADITVEVDGARVHHDGQTDGTVVRVAINEEGYQHEARPLAWCNSAGIHLDTADDSVTVAISTGDPRGAFTMTIRRNLDGQIVMHVPHPSDGSLHEPLTPHHDGTYLVNAPSNPDARVAS